MAKIEKADREQLLYIIAEEFGGDGKAWEQLAVEMVKAMSDTQAREILGYIAKNWDIDTMGYEASAKKSKIKKDADYKLLMDLKQVLGNTREIVQDAYDDLSSLLNGEYTTLVAYVPKGYEFNIGSIRDTLKYSVLNGIDKVMEDCDNGVQYEDYSASAKKSKPKSFNEMIKEQRKQYKNKKVL